MKLFGVTLSLAVALASSTAMAKTTVTLAFVNNPDIWSS